MAPSAVKKRKTNSNKPVPTPVKSTKDNAADDSGSDPGDGVALEQANSNSNSNSDDDDDDDDKYESAEEDSDDGALEDEFDVESGSGSDSGSDDDDITDILAAQHDSTGKKRKRHDADAFASSMSKILSSHLTTAARKDPVLVRAKQMAGGADEGKLEAKARRVLKEEKRREREKGRVRELMPEGEEGKALERERLLKGVARTGVARLYNAIRAAQVKAEEARREVKKEGVVGIANREAKVVEMSKQGFLELIQAAGKK